MGCSSMSNQRHLPTEQGDHRDGNRDSFRAWLKRHNPSEGFESNVLCRRALARKHDACAIGCCAFSRSEGKLYSELKYARWKCLRNLAESRATHVVDTEPAGGVPVGLVEHVESVCLQPQAHAFARQSEVLSQRHIPLVERRTNNVAGGRIAGSKWRLSRESAGVNPADGVHVGAGSAK